MNKKESLMILSVLQAVYPAGFKDSSDEDKIALANLWARIFKNVNYEDVSNAVDTVIATNKTNFPPSPGLVMDQVIKNTSDSGMNEMEAWNLVYKAIKRSAWYAEKEFKKLPEQLRRCVGSPEMLKSWSGMPIDTVNSVIQSNFMRSYRSGVGREKEMMAISGEVKDKIMKLSEVL